MIYITGDTHREFDRLFELDGTLSNKDSLIIAGDFGGVWTNDKSDDRVLNQLEKLSYTVCFVDGNHENFYALNHDYPVVLFHGGAAHQIRKNIFHLMRGYIFKFNDLKFFVFGGARSQDISGGILDVLSPTFFEDYEAAEKSGLPYRYYGISWWKEEMPSKTEMEFGLDVLSANNYDVDYIITHDAPTSIQKLLLPYAERDILTDYLQKILEKTKFKHWYFGHYHQDRDVAPNMTCLYKQIKQIGGI